MALLTIIVFLLQLTSNVRVNSEPTQDKQALLAFLSQTPHSNRLQWNASASACDWVGVKCDVSRSFVYSLRLPAVDLVGPVPPATIGRLSQLRILSLRSNGLTGEIPGDFSNLTLLRNLYLQKNQFSGEFPPSLTRLTRLTRLDLSSNNFTGQIPFSVNNLTHLTGLFLEHNSFSGKIPSITAKLVDFNVSFNRLNGSIPETLSTFPNSSFAGNIDLCGPPLTACNPFFPAPAPSPSSNSTPTKTHKSKKLSTGAIVAIVVGSVLVAALLLLLLGYHRGFGGSGKEQAGVLRRGIYSFDLEDLLRASAEVLGKGSVGTSYKAVLEEGTTVVVKRLKDVVVTKKEFELQMEVLGKIKHENVVPLRAFYFSKDEKLLVYDYMSAGSLSALLHGIGGVEWIVDDNYLTNYISTGIDIAGSRGSGRTPLDWDSRMKIAVGAARGLACLHVAGKVVHGNIKSSNILLRGPDHDAGVSDFGLNPLFGNGAPSNRVAGYRAPEVVETRKVSFKSDVYSFGVLLLELLTGKAPNQASLGEEGIDLPRWVQSVVREEWTAEVFDAELMRYHNFEEEMVQLLQIAMACVSVVPDQRPSMQDVVRMIEDINRGETDDGLRQSSDDPSKGSEGHTPPPESRTPRSLTP
ncbi:hypothetical protein ACSQ67_006916 [Phaseolus vulgaris]